MNYFNKETTVMYTQTTGGLGVLSNQRDSCGATNAIAPPPRRLESCMKRFDQLLSSYADIAQQAEMLAATMAGPTPQPPDSNQASPDPVALIGQLEYLADQFNGRMQRIQSALRRLQEL